MEEKATGGNGESAKIPINPDEDVYAPSRYSPDYSPLLIYIPKKEVMFKMMRACIGVKCTSDLWINRNDPNKIL